LLVANAASRGELAKEHLDAWAQWSEVRDRRQPPTVAVWISKYAVEDAARWAVQERGIVWYENTAFGEAVSEALGQEHLTSVADLVIDGAPQILSIARFGTGIDGLQRVYDRCLYTTVPNAKALEQSLGRLHREGQGRPVTADIYLPLPESVETLNRTKESAKYCQQSGFGMQKLLNCELEGIE
jgi:hypothetical protein